MQEIIKYNNLRMDFINETYYDPKENISGFEQLLFLLNILQLQLTWQDSLFYDLDW